MAKIPDPTSSGQPKLSMWLKAMEYVRIPRGAERGAEPNSEMGEETSFAVERPICWEMRLDWACNGASG